MNGYFDHLETRDPAAREVELAAQLPSLIERVIANGPGWAKHLAGVNPGDIASREALATLPVLRKSELHELQMQSPPFGGFVGGGHIARIMASPGPIYEPFPAGRDPSRMARALHAAGFRDGDIVHNSFAYHLTPGGFMLDEGARALGCVVVPGGVGNTEQQAEAIRHLRPAGYTGTPDFLKVLLDRVEELSGAPASISKALVSGGALFPAMREDYERRGVSVLQCYVTSEAGLIAYESTAREGMIACEDIVVEIVRPGTGDPVPDGEVGEVVVTTFCPVYPMIRLATGDLSAILTGESPCGRTNRRIKGWLGRADQTTKVKGMFVHPSQVAEVGRRHPELGRLRLVIGRDGDTDTMTLKAEYAGGDEGLAARVAESLAASARLKGAVELVALGTLPNDGKVISDERDYK